MACCILTAYCMSQLIKACDYLDLGIIKAEYNIFHDGPDDSMDVSGMESRLTTSKIALEGMTCAACVSSIEKAVSALDGVKRITVSLPLSRGTVVHRGDVVEVEKIVGVIEERGYGARVGQRSAKENLEFILSQGEKEELRQTFAHAVLLSTTLTWLEWSLWLPLPQVVVRLVRVVVGGLAIWLQTTDAEHIHRNAWKRGLSASLTMDSLVSLSLLLGIALSCFNLSLFGLDDAKTYWSSISFLTTVIIGARFLDLVLRKQGTATFAELYELQDKAMYVKRFKLPFGQEGEVVNAATLVPRDQISIKPGAIIPCDCYIMEGETLVDQATMTGESLPVPKREGDQLMAGTTNLSHELRAVVSKVQEDSALESLIASISAATEASTSNTEVDLMISKFAGAILVLTVASFANTLAVNWNEIGLYLAINAACERAMAVLASACPCALGLARPTAVMAGLNAAHLRGVIVKGGFASLKSLAELSHIVLDKTGTLTTGILSVSGTNREFCGLYRSLLCVAEREYSDHPVARAVFQWAYPTLNLEQRQLVNDAVVCRKSNKKENGVICDITLRPEIGEWWTVHVGNEAFFSQHNIALTLDPKERNPDPNHTMVHLAMNKEYIGSLHLRDTIRPDAAAVTSYLKENVGLNVAMLTGDAEDEAHRVSKQLSIDVSSSHATPLAKQAYIQALRESDSHHRVAMMGDGLNDAPALATADVGIALNVRSRHSNPSIAQATNAQVGDVIFTSPQLGRLPELLEIAKKTTAQAKMNLWWAVAYNVVAVSLAMGLLEPFGLMLDASRAGTMMAFSSISVIVWGVWLQAELWKVSFEKMKRKGKR